jgi:hypothetical protein
MVHGSWFMVHGSWFIVHGSWFMVHGSVSVFQYASTHPPRCNCIFAFISRTELYMFRAFAMPIIRSNIAA